MNLIEALSCIEDVRRSQGKRYPLTSVLLITITSIICGYVRYREIARFAAVHKKELQCLFSRKIDMPSHVTFRKVLQSVAFEKINKAFIQWAKQYVTVEKKDWICIDGKAIGSTVSNYDQSYQNFISLVSLFSQKRGQVLGTFRIENKKESEIHAVQKMIQLFDLKDVIFTMDALHCKKKTLDRIIESGNNYLVQVKANQPNLLNSLRRTVQNRLPISSCKKQEKNHGRLENREISVFLPYHKIPLPEGWRKIERIIYIRREFIYKNKCHKSESYYISSISDNRADVFRDGIRGHWLIENQLHYVKDVNLHEDTSGIRNLVAASNLSILRNIAINIARQNHFKSMKDAAVMFSSNINRLLKIIFYS